MPTWVGRLACLSATTLAGASHARTRRHGFEQQEIERELRGAGGRGVVLSGRHTWSNLMICRTKRTKRIIWKAWAPPKCKFFAWLLVQDRVWTSQRLQLRQCVNQYFYPMCRQNLETSLHLFVEFRESRAYGLRFRSGWTYRPYTQMLGYNRFLLQPGGRSPYYSQKSYAEESSRSFYW